MTQMGATHTWVETTYSTVVVPVDFTTLGWRALPLAEVLSRIFDLPLEVVHVDTASPWRGGSEELVLRGTPHGGKVRIRVIAAEDVGAGLGMLSATPRPLVVMSTHAHTGVGELASGSSLEKVLHVVESPIVTVGPRFSSANVEVKRLVACLDATRAPTAFVHDIATWSSELSVPVDLLTVVAHPGAYDDIAPAEQERLLYETGDLLADMGVATRPVVLRGARPGHEIVEYVDDIPGTLTALTTHSRGPATRTIVGSVGMKVVRQSQNPVLLRRRAG